MQNILILQLDQTEAPGFIEEFFQISNIVFEVRKLYEDMRPVNYDDFSHLIVMPSPKDTFECEQFPFLMMAKEVVNGFLSLNKPILGICMGAQLIAECLGEEVGRAEAPEVGFYKIDIIDQNPLLNESSEVFEWHSMEIKTHNNIELKANSENCRTQIFQYRDNVFGLQFHLEITTELLGRYLDIFDSERKHSSLQHQKEKMAEYKEIQSNILLNFIKQN